jgi:ubiquinone/menaquinone biosynthesis C-methylase UbiE
MGGIVGTKFERERGFWNAKAAFAEDDPELFRVQAGDRYDRCIPWLPQLGFPAFVECMLDRIGNPRGKRVLDVGTGTGFIAALLAAEGAEVDSVDVSDESLEKARLRAGVSGLGDRIRFHACPAEALPFRDDSFDALCGAFVLHHLDLPAAARELRRVLRPGGRAAFVETSANNRLLMIARRYLCGRLGIEKASSEDEAPLGASARASLEQVFGQSVAFHYPDTVLLRMGGYIPPLHRPRAQQVLAFGDALIHRLPALRSQSYFCVISFERVLSE